MRARWRRDPLRAARGRGAGSARRSAARMAVGVTVASTRIERTSHTHCMSIARASRG
ncbi:hypothetical protein C7S16_4706 [Burkholderia thailandensis]|uniref:Uncharacterized protein n=1 Tax=Burkholderia thailandensis TaxID=57975 RepID=A0AAW9CQX5_BURTH|nr:hypothetical protein [Burkholderia thailandensis]